MHGERRTYSVDKDLRVEIHAGKSDSSKLLLLISLQKVAHSQKKKSNTDTYFEWQVKS